MRAIVRRLGRLETQIARSEYQGPSPATILCERRRRRLAASGLPPDPPESEWPFPLDGRPLTLSEVLRQGRFLRHSADPASYRY